MRARVEVILLLVLTVAGVLSLPQVTAATYTLDFPGIDDTWKFSDFIFCAIGDYVYGTRYVDIAQFNKIKTIEIYLDLEWNTYDNTQIEFKVSLNGEPVGIFFVYGSELQPKKTISLEPELILTESWVEIRYEVKNLDGSGGIKVRQPGSSTLTLIDGSETKRDFALQALRILNQLRGKVDQSSIDQGPKHRLLSKLDGAIVKVDQALVYIEKGDNEKANNKLRIAKNSVLSFVKTVDMLSDRIDPSYSGDWRNDANEIIRLIDKAIATPIID